MPLNEDKPRIVVVGAGFGGVYAFKRLHSRFHKTGAELVLINPENYFLFTPLLHEVATGSIFPENIIEPLRKVVGCCMADFYPSRVTRIDRAARTVETGLGTVAYDYLVLAPGAQTNFYGTPGAEEHAYALKSIDDALALKNRFIGLFERALKEKDREARRRMLHFAVVGGGPTGVELAAEMSEFFYDTFRKFFDCREMMDDVKITLVQKGGELIPQFSPHMRRKSAKTLARKKVDLRFGAGVSEVRADGATLENGEELFADTVIWTAGIKPSDIPFADEPARTRGRLVVDQYLRLPDDERVYALGDAAAFTPEGEDAPLPALAQVATAQGRAVADNIARAVRGEDAEPFRYTHKGNLVSLGQWVAIAEIGRFHSFGHLAWWVWRTIYLSKLLSWSKKFQVALDWTIDLFTPRDISKF